MRAGAPRNDGVFFWGREGPRLLMGAAAAQILGYMPIEDAAAFFAVRRLAGFFAFRAAGFRVAFLATFFLAGFFAALLRAGFFAAALRTVARFFAGFLFAVIGMKRLPLTLGSARHAPPTNARKYEEVRLTKQYQRFHPDGPVKTDCIKCPILLAYFASSVHAQKLAHWA